MKETIQKAIARTGLLCAYADAMESDECPACEALDADADVEQDGRDVLSPLWRGDTCRNCGAEFPRAGAGEDWDDTTPDVVDTTAEAWAVRVVADFEERNGRSLVDMGEAWDTARNAGDPTAEFEWSDDGAERFGHCVAMEYLGTGVGLEDDIRHGTPYARPTSGDIDLGRWEIDFGPFRQDDGDTLDAFDEIRGVGLFVDGDGNASVYALRLPGSGIGNAWAHGVGFEFCRSAFESEARMIRAADTGAAFRGDRVRAALRAAEVAFDAECREADDADTGA